MKKDIIGYLEPAFEKMEQGCKKCKFYECDWKKQNKYRKQIKGCSDFVANQN